MSVERDSNPANAEHGAHLLQMQQQSIDVHHATFHGESSCCYFSLVKRFVFHEHPLYVLEADKEMQAYSEVPIGKEEYYFLGTSKPKKIIGEALKNQASFIKLRL